MAKTSSKAAPSSNGSALSLAATFWATADKLLGKLPSGKWLAPAAKPVPVRA